MDYEKKLKETLVNGNAGYEVTRWIEQTFPELKESEDERIRKEIVRFIQMEVEDEIVGNKWLAWLEKQSKKSKVEQAMREVEEKADAFTEAHKGETSDEILAQMRGEQNPAWSEEDRQTLRLIIDDLSEELNDEPDEAEKEILCRKISFLKSLKPHPIHVWSREDNRTRLEITNYLECQKREEPTRTDILNKWIAWIANLDPQGIQGSQFKPSDEQMKALSNINLTGGISYAGQGQELINLYNDLKKLK